MAPVAPKGRSMAMAPPFTLLFSEHVGILLKPHGDKCERFVHFIKVDPVNWHTGNILDFCVAGAAPGSMIKGQS